MLCSSCFRLTLFRLTLYSQAQGSEDWMAKFVACKLLLVFILVTFSKSSELQHGLASKGQRDLLCVVPRIQASKEAIIIGFNAGFFSGWLNVHMVELVEVLYGIP